MGIFSNLFGTDTPKEPEPKAVLVDEGALPGNVRTSFAALRDFEQLFVEDKRYTASVIFPTRDSWLQDFRALVLQLANDPMSGDLKKMRSLESIASKMERIMGVSSVRIPGGASVYYLKEEMLGHAVEGMEGIVVSRESSVSGGKRVAYLKFLLMDGQEILVREDELHSGGAVSSDPEMSNEGEDVNA